MSYPRLARRRCLRFRRATNGGGKAEEQPAGQAVSRLPLRRPNFRHLTERHFPYRTYDRLMMNERRRRSSGRSTSSSSAGNNEGSDELTWTPRGWVEPGPPATCPNGHPLRGPYRCLVGSQACECGTIHRAFHCRSCTASVYRPTPGPDCSFVDFDGRRRPV